jgi:hypothetical protein
MQLVDVLKGLESRLERGISRPRCGDFEIPKVIVDACIIVLSRFIPTQQARRARGGFVPPRTVIGELWARTQGEGRLYESISGAWRRY